MALFDSQYSLDQAYSPFTNNMIRPSGQKQGDFGKTLGGLSSRMGQSALDDSYLKYHPQQQFPEQQLGQYQSSIYGNPLNQQPSYTQTDIESGDPGLGKTMLGIGSGMMGQQLQPFEEQIAQPPELSPPIMPPPVQPTMPSPIMSQPVQPTMPSATPMPGDVGYVPYGSSNNQPFVQGLAGGGPIRNLSFVELLRQTMEN